ncbi:MAG: Gfo/Idh/MocA family oxidoreductase [Verrucomicrobia bacterium]|jgi:hypothetical protein|nr:Gfo/Idh/MocA family oxidoreductase [Verrucomicrobiota bacterium]MBT7065198.1 Gfo/Idh/MocA family oxidoreductase [Verrucomicrobiota bacterium]MBT7701971.1 Gfo/Idh/MocA family oxidoreductase [Verrucomicrobiota bacterium]
MNIPNQSRRTFIKSVGAAAVALPNIITSNALGANGVPPASERIVMAGLGMGNRGTGVLGAFLNSPDIQVVAVNDVQKSHLTGAANRVNGKYRNQDCATYEDYREILARDDIDMVFCAPPDHWHAQMMVDACKAGKDVMCEKPLTLTIAEGRKIVDAARRYGRIAAGGSQRVLEDFGRAACAANSGRFGKILSANASPGGPPRPCYLPGQPVSDDINWDLWLGPAPWAPYHPYRCSRAYGLNGKGFRTWEDYSGGMMTDWGGHKFGGALHGLRLDHTGPSEIIPPKDGEPLTYVFATGQTLKVQGGPNYVCEGGDVNKNSMRDLKVPPGLRWYSGGANSLVGDFIHCVKTREAPFRDVEWSHRTATVCHLGNIALKLKRTLKWDPVNEDFIGDSEASRLVDRPRRGPWQI